LATVVPGGVGSLIDIVALGELELLQATISVHTLAPAITPVMKIFRIAMMDLSQRCSAV
jgi:hypothetical protein